MSNKASSNAGSKRVNLAQVRAQLAVLQMEQLQLNCRLEARVATLQIQAVSLQAKLVEARVLPEN